MILPVHSKKHASVFVVITQGKKKASDMAKKIMKGLHAGTADEIIRFLKELYESINIIE